MRPGDLALAARAVEGLAVHVVPRIDLPLALLAVSRHLVLVVGRRFLLAAHAEHGRPADVVRARVARALPAPHGLLVDVLQADFLVALRAVPGDAAHHRALVQAPAAGAALGRRHVTLVLAADVARLRVVADVLLDRPEE